MSETIQIGIDLGTTNSEVAVFVNGKTEVIKNIYGDSYTPSVFGVDKAGNKIVGKKAYENLFKNGTDDEITNNKAEVKRLMGTSDKTEFPRLHKSFSAEEISAEILKSLREDVGRKYPDINTKSVVITVPAYFSILQSEATKRAGMLAGFEHVILLQEPIAAAIAYGFQTSGDHNWLVYDFGGGTFDVALISSRKGTLTVLESGGDNFLGGKDIDWLIVEKIFVPKILQKYDLKEFNRSNKKFRTIFSRLKYLAEDAKIELSQLDKTLKEIDLKTEDSQEIVLNIEIERSEFEKLLDTLLNKTIAIAKETIKRAGVASSAVDKIVLVGGPTQTPYLRRRLEKTLGIKVDTSLDCLTVVATGACLYGLSQKAPDSLKPSKERKKGTLSLKLHYATLTSETDEPISGSLEGKLEDEYTLQIQSEDGQYTSPRIPLKKGKFIESVVIEPNKSNLFWLYLFDSKGNPVSVEPESFVITHGLSVSGAPIAHSIGISIRKQIFIDSGQQGEFVVYFEKGSNLPLTFTKSFRTAEKIIRGSDNVLPIVVLEGESNNPENNIYIGSLGIDGKGLPHDLPVGTDIEVTITVDESRGLSVSYYIPIIDKTGNLRITTWAEEIDVTKLEESLDKQKKQFSKLRELSSEEEQNEIENLIESVSTSVSGAGSDQDDRRKADSEIKQLRERLEKLDKSKQPEMLKANFDQMLEAIPQLIASTDQSEDKEAATRMLISLKEQGAEAIQTKDEKLLARTNEQLVMLAVRLYYSNPQGWLEQFQKHSNGEFKYTNPESAKYFLEKGRKAIEANNIEDLKSSVKELQNLMENQEEREDVNIILSGLTR